MAMLKMAVMAGGSEMTQLMALSMASVWLMEWRING